MRIKRVGQAALTRECWDVQFWGLDACSTCECRDTEECDGQDVRKTGKNDKNISVPVSEKKEEVT